MVRIDRVGTGHLSLSPICRPGAFQQHALSGRDIRAIVDTEIEIEVQSNLPLQEGTLQLFERKARTSQRNHS